MARCNYRRLHPGDSLCANVGSTDCIPGKQDQAAFAEASRMFVNPDALHGWRRLCSSLRAFDSMHALDDVPEDPKELMENNAAF